MVGCSNSSSSTSENKPQVEKTEISNNEVKAEVLLDNETVKITFLGVNESALMGSEMKVEIENKTDKTITIQLNEIQL